MQKIEITYDTSRRSLTLFVRSFWTMWQTQKTLIFSRFTIFPFIVRNNSIYFSIGGSVCLLPPSPSSPPLPPLSFFNFHLFEAAHRFVTKKAHSTSVFTFSGAYKYALQFIAKKYTFDLANKLILSYRCWCCRHQTENCEIDGGNRRQWHYKTRKEKQKMVR